MIQILGLQTSVYVNYQIISKETERKQRKESNKSQIRITTQVIQVAQISNYTIQEYIENNTQMQMDGQCKITKGNQIIEIYQMIQIVQMQQQFTTSQLVSEIYQIVQCSIIGMTFQQNSNDQVVTITAWEQQNQALYQMVSMQGADSYNGGSQSAGIKYFQQSAQTTGFFQMGVAQIYSQTGTTNYDQQKMMLIYQKDGENAYIQQMSQMIISQTFVFKQAAAPFHNWAPDLYDNIPTPIAMWFAIIPKFSQQVLLFQLYPMFQQIDTFWFIIGSLSLIIGSIGLGSQWKIKRFIAYSAISHLGFILLSFITMSFDSFFYYIQIYGINSIQFFAIIISISKTIPKQTTNKTDGPIYLQQQSGLYKQNPALALAFAFCLFSFAGIPPLAGFFGKQQVIQALLSLNYITITQIIVITSAISTANYLSVIRLSLFDQPQVASTFAISRTYSYIISIISTFLLFYFQKPSILISILSISFI